MKSGVFITDGHWRKSLAAVRGLGLRRVAVTVGESTWLATAAFSRYCTRRVVYPSVLYRPDEFLAFLLDDLRRHPRRLLLPMEDATILLAARHRDLLERHTCVPVVEAKTLALAQRKDEVLRLAQRLGIPTPRTWFVEHLSDLGRLKNELPYPVVIKPRQGSGAVGVSYITRAAQFEATYRRVHQTYPFPLVQERLPAHGPGLGASFLIGPEGRVLAAFMHQRLREYPLSGGASTLRVSVHRDDIREMGLALLKALDWYGVAMVEFKIDVRDHQPKLMEINPRFWGSLALAVHAGVNFPYLLYRMAAGERFAPVVDYRAGVMCRWLLPGDLLHYLHNRRRHRLEPGFFNLRGPDLHYDIVSLRDPMPILGRLLTPLTFLYDQDMKQRLRHRRGQR
jgi:predicted ATP-grasp superfamily ATP-dependent carboligase